MDMTLESISRQPLDVAGPPPASMANGKDSVVSASMQAENAPWSKVPLFSIRDKCSNAPL
jgi:hypothetical protein